MPPLRGADGAAGAQSVEQLRLRGCRYDDLCVEVLAGAPVNRTARQRELLQEYEKASADDSPDGKGFFRKVKDFWGHGRLRAAHGIVI